MPFHLISRHQKAIIEFLDYLPDFYKLIDLCIGQKVDHDGYKVTEKANFELDLSKPYEKIWENFSPHCKRNIESLQERSLN